MYDLPKITQLLSTGFDTSELKHLAMVIDSALGQVGSLKVEVNQMTDFGDMVSKIIGYALRQEKLDIVLNWCKAHNPARYDKYSPYSKGAKGANKPKDDLPHIDPPYLKNITLPPGTDMRDSKFKGVDFSGSDFEGANFNKANFTEATFERADFSKVDLRPIKGKPRPKIALNGRIADLLNEEYKADKEAD